MSLVTGEDLYNFYRNWYLEEGAVGMDPWGADPRDCCAWDDMAAAIAKPPLVLTGLIEATEHRYMTGTRQLLKNVHDPSKCEGENCVIHNPSDHPLRDAPTHWRVDPLEPRQGEIMQRICPHGVFHPDPDDLAFIVRNHGQERANELTEHYCCGCCKEEKE